MPDRRTHLLDTALALVAEKGMKGLTHRAVDAAAALPAGTTSNYYRNRSLLVGAVLERLLQLDAELLQDYGRAGPPQDLGQLAGQMAALVLTLAQQHAGLTRARLAFSLDHPEAVTAGHHVLVDGLEQALAAMAVVDAQARARDVADYCDGLLLHLLTVRRGDNPDPAVIAGAIRRLLSP